MKLVEGQTALVTGASRGLGLVGFTRSLRLTARPAVIQAIEGDLPDVFVSQGDPRQIAAMGVMDPGAAELGALSSAGTAMFRSVADARSASAIKEKAAP